MTIGTGSKNAEGNLELLITIPFAHPETLTLIKVTEKAKETSPDYLIHLGGPIGLRVGAAWRNVPKGGGDAYLSGQIESPALHWLGYRLEIAIFGAKQENRKGWLDVVWSPPKSREESAPAPRSDGEAEDDIPF